jgi:MoxR-like ATPase
MNTDLEHLKEVLARTKSEINKVIIGQDSVIDQALIVILTASHGLIEGVPGTAKTLLVRTLGHVLGCEVNRIQFTPDLMPSDITGTNVFNLKTNEFTLQRGPIFTSFLVADEINRAPAKTQSSLLQAMQERAVSIDRQTFPLSPNFTVFATMNPIEYEGTYPLPEAQKDRFMLKISMGCPERADELQLAQRTLQNDAPESALTRIDPVLTPETLMTLRAQLQSITLREELLQYLVDLVRETRNTPSIMVGAGPRATQALLLASRAFAVINGRDFVTPEDIRAMAAPVLTHRLVMRPEYEIEGVTLSEIIEKLLQEVPVPR